jgi:hypothetical protein
MRVSESSHEPRQRRSARCRVQLLTTLAWLLVGVTPSAAQPPNEGHVRERLALTVLSAIVVTEAFAFGSATAALDRPGARVVGAVDGIGGLAVLAVAVARVGESDRPEFLVPYGVGLLALSFYNFGAAESPDRGERFWINAVGFNAVVVIGLLSSMTVGSAERRAPNVSIHLRATALLVSMRF